MPLSAQALRQQLAKPAPPKGATWSKLWIVLAVTAICDALRAFFVALIFTGPILIGLLAAHYASASSWLGWIPQPVVAAITAGGLGAVEAAQPEIAGAIEGFGVMMAIFVGLIGIGLLVALLAFRRIKLSASNRLWLGVALIGGITPFVDAFPSLTPIAWHILRSQIKQDKKKLAAYTAEQAQLAAQLRQAELAERQQQAFLLQAANDNEAAQEEQDEAEQAAAEEQVAEEEPVAPIQYGAHAPLVGVPSL